MDGLKSTNRRNDAGRKGVKLYLRVHVMPKLNMPLKGRPWQWIIPAILMALLVVVALYYFAE